MAIECLNCGETRHRHGSSVHRVIQDDSCPRCGYVGWARSGELSEQTRRRLRERPLFRRRMATLA